MKYLTMINAGAINICKNLLLSAKKVEINVEKDFIIGCLDKKSFIGIGWPSNRTFEFENKENWIVHDINLKIPFPFPDKYFDFSVCSQTLEDIRDPIYALSEISRISKSGYIEFPNSSFERSNHESKYYVGAAHHRWLIDIDKNDNLNFFFKYGYVHKNLKKRIIHNDFQSKNTSLIWVDKINGYEDIKMEWGGHGILKKLYPEFSDKQISRLHSSFHDKYCLIRGVINFFKKLLFVKKNINYFINTIKKKNNNE
jgi:SAM-dependent methyltransferase